MLSKKIVLKDTNLYTQKHNVWILNVLFDNYKPIKFYINYSVRKETISQLTMGIN